MWRASAGLHACGVLVQAAALLNDMGSKYKDLEAGMDDNAQVGTSSRVKAWRCPAWHLRHDYAS